MTGIRSIPALSAELAAYRQAWAGVNKRVTQGYGVKISATVGRQNKSVKVAWRLMNTLAKWKPKIEDGMLLVAKFLYDESRKLVPKDTGSLYDSARFRWQVRSDGWKDMYVGYGPRDFATKSRFSRDRGKNVDREPWRYAFWVHENMTATHHAGQQANFLRDPARAKLPEMRKLFVNTVHTSGGLANPQYPWD